jgi:hypothetical protein
MRPTIERIFVVPGLTTQSAQIIVHEALEGTPAATDWTISVPDRTVRVTMGDLDGEVSVRHHLISAGFPPED